MIRMRYEIVSYSQHTNDSCAIWVCCLWYVWDTKLSAIHNWSVWPSPCGVVVYDTYEIRNCQLFTTYPWPALYLRMLFMIRMRYEIVSYSQRQRSVGFGRSVVYDTYEIRNCQLFTTESFGTHSLQRCLWYVWDTKLSAIHNQGLQPPVRPVVVYDTYEIRNCQLFTTALAQRNLHFSLFMIRMRYEIVSYSQQWSAAQDIQDSCLWYVWDTKLSAIHNEFFWNTNCHEVVYDTYEIRNCQLFTTQNKLTLCLRGLFMIRMRYEIVSYSQPSTVRCRRWASCLWYVWDTKLSAIHNAESRPLFPSSVVYDTYEIRNCQLFTTAFIFVPPFV